MYRDRGECYTCANVRCPPGQERRGCCCGGEHGWVCAAAAATPARAHTWPARQRGLLRRWRRRRRHGGRARGCPGGRPAARCGPRPRGVAPPQSWRHTRCRPGGAGDSLQRAGPHPAPTWARARAAAAVRTSTVANPAFHDYLEPDQGQLDKNVAAKRRGGDLPEHAQPDESRPHDYARSDRGSRTPSTRRSRAGRLGPDHDSAPLAVPPSRDRRTQPGALSAAQHGQLCAEHGGRRWAAAAQQHAARQRGGAVSSASWARSSRGTGSSM